MEAEPARLREAPPFEPNARPEPLSAPGGIIEGLKVDVMVRLQPHLTQRPVRLLMQVAAAGFLLGIVLPARAQVALLQAALRTGAYRLLRRAPKK